MTTAKPRSTIHVSCLTLFVVMVLVACIGESQAAENVGCLLSKRVCGKLEWCYDDFAFGRCLPLYNSITESDLYRYSLEKEALKQLEREIRRLFTAGYRWAHTYTQCIVKNILSSFRSRTAFERSKCNGKQDEDLAAALQFLEAEDVIDPRDVAVIRFQPSLADGGAPSDYGDELFFPSGEMYHRLRALEQAEEEAAEQEGGSDVGVLTKFPTDESNERIQHQVAQEDRHKPKNNRHKRKQKPQFSEINLTEDDLLQLLQFLDEYDKNENERRIPDEFRNSDVRYEDVLLDDSENVVDDQFEEEPQTWSFSKHAHKNRLKNNRNVEQEVEEDYFALPTDDNYDVSDLDFGEKDTKRNSYMVGLDPIFAFERMHRYDVKKPGPYFKVNNYVFEKEEEKNQSPVSDDPVIFKYHPLFEEEDTSTASIRHRPLVENDRNLINDFDAEGMVHPLGSNDDSSSSDQEPKVYENQGDTEKNESQSQPDADKRSGPSNLNREVDFPLSLPPKHSHNFNLEDLSAAAENLGLYDDSIGDDSMLGRGDDQYELPDTYPAEFPFWNPYDETDSDGNPFLSVPPQKVEHRHKSGRFGKISPADDTAEIRIRPNENEPAVYINKNEQRNSVPFSDSRKRKFGALQANLVAPDNTDATSGSADNREMVQESSGDKLDVVDTSYAYVTVDKTFSDYKEGKQFLKMLETLMKLETGTFSHITVRDNKVTFKVNNNNGGVNASYVAIQSVNFEDELFKKTGKRLMSAGIGNKSQLAVEEFQKDNRFFVITFLVCGAIAGIIIAVGVFYVVRRHARSREKLQNITQLDTEASQDYQDLCRQRMATKSSEKPEPIHAVQRISSLSKDGEASARSPSSRSSTSSWNEEPVISNMDISTGHMVLSYMEDHLNNKDRLEQEWVALCAYEADPAAVTAATDPSNTKKNRYEQILPYDHSRVVINDVTNVAGSDYINASTITDHDPRNPAYIATQGPMPHTSADFWQMIWEQGSVVIVMLTRLVDNGMAMCHRYWPEEGSELYHIYEVHLVSEHIWCEDYLVRSFYLKNVKTGETRTVTQFHFLSWPDNGVPSSTKALLDFRRKVNKSYRGRSCPIAVHCSDGTGRSGTYILIDMVLNRMAKGAKEIDIAATLEHIRDQRVGMVRTKAQFEFVLMSIAEEVHAILKAIPQ